MNLSLVLLVSDKAIIISLYQYQFYNYMHLMDWLIMAAMQHAS